MATSAKRPTKQDPHAPVSNLQETVEAAVKKPASKPPSEGTDKKTSKPRPDGSEAVTGFALPKEVAAAAAALHAPETTDLRDIAEATYGPTPAHIEIVHGPDDRVQITT